MREKKFSKSRVLALVLAFAMVVTALPFAGFDAKAADENNSVTVYRAYNTQTNDHLFTADENEYKTTIANPIWNDEGRAWSAPKESTTPIYRAYNTSNGEHLYTADAGEYASLPGGWNKEGTLLYSDDAMGKPVYRLFCAEWDLHLYTADENEMSTLLASGSWTADFDGAPAYYALADKSAEVSLIDEQGLQADGTALGSDILAVVFGSDLGVPEAVAWYYNGAIVKVSTNNLGANDFRLGNGVGTQATDNKDGEYYAVVTVGDKSYKTNSIMVGVATEGIMTNYSLNNNMGALMNFGSTYSERIKTGNNTAAAALAEMIEIDQNADNVVVSVTMNKKYDGYLYLVDAESLTLTAGDVGTEIDLKTRTATAGGTIEKVDRESKMTDAELWKTGYNTTAGNELTTTGSDGIYYVAEDGTTTYKLFNKAFGAVRLERGKEYVLVLSEDQLKAGDSVLGLNCSDEMECPYVLAPDDIEITSAAAGTGMTNTGWDVQLNASYLGMEASWITNVTDLTAPVNMGAYASNDKAKVIFYENSVSKNSGGTVVQAVDPLYDPATLVPPTSQAMDAAPVVGTAQTGAMARILIGGQAPVAKKIAYMNNPASKAVYAEFTADAGIFGEDEVKLVSSAVEKTADPATAWTAEWEGEDVTVNITGLSSSASGTLYLFNGTKEVNTYDKIAGQDEIKALDAIDIDGATEEAVFEGVLNQTQLNGKTTKSSASFSVVFIPDDTTRYAEVNRGGSYNALNFTISDVETTYELGGVTTGVKSGTTLTVNAKNQFGTSMTAAAQAAKSGKFVSVDGTTADQSVDVAIAAGGGVNGIVTIQGTPNLIKKGDKYEVTLNKTQKLVLEATTNLVNDPEFKATIEYR